ncbi:hypothetical protein [Aquimarina sp. AU119]|uniref:hypothetical protein n=1 Tax=Aquimarina sp. AU119 TaxID=2108528 RepID=UPI000D689CB3|nr:hypothetical protein [Aquimarina sp. AU119]
MNTSIDYKLKKGFRNLFPEYAKQLDTAKTQQDIDKLQEQFILDAKQNLAKVLGKDVSKLTATDQTASMPLGADQYEILKNATGDSIKTQLMVLIDGLNRLKGMDDDGDPGLVTAQILLSGALGIGGISTTSVIGSLASGATASIAALTGVTVATVAVVVAIIGLVIVSIIIPIIYFILKPASCIILLINELDKPLTFKNDYNVHGKPRLMTTPIKNGIILPEYGTYPVSGFFVTEKSQNALVGTQYGFVMNYDDMDLAFGVQNPLSSIYEDNNCYCAIGETAKNVAIETQKSNKQEYTTTKNGIGLSIRVNSGSGSIAYYVARAFKL